MEMFWNQINVVMVAQHCECTKCHWTIQFKTVKIVYMYFAAMETKIKKKKKKSPNRTPLMVQWLRIRLAMQGACVQLPSRGTKLPYASGQLNP